MGILPVRPWTASLGYGVFFLFLVYWQHIRRFFRSPIIVFFDKLCISQDQEDLKLKSIYGLASFLDRSDELVILWSETYFSRLWCTYERLGLGSANVYSNFRCFSLHFQHFNLVYWLKFDWINFRSCRICCHSFWYTSLIACQDRYFSTRWARHKEGHRATGAGGCFLQHQLFGVVHPANRHHIDLIWPVTTSNDGKFPVSGRNSSIPFLDIEAFVPAPMDVHDERCGGITKADSILRNPKCQVLLLHGAA